MKRTVTGATLALAAALMGGGINAALAQADKKMSADAKRGMYMLQIGGCNDCHTPEYPEKDGKVDEKLWMTGSILGWHGPWGTTYASNLRLIVAKMSEAEWMKHARAARRPPMPWFNLRDMSDADVRAIYAYLKFAGPAGKPAPDYLPPGKAPPPPFVTFPAPPPGKK